MVSLPSASATCAHTVLIDFVSAVVRSTSPNDWLKSLFRGTPEILMPFLPLTVEDGVYLPESIAAIAVTTLKVEPGGYPDCVTRSKSGAFLLSRLSARNVRALRTSFGSKPGVLAKTLTAPVRGSSATTAPLHGRCGQSPLASPLRATRWACTSSEVI